MGKIANKIVDLLTNKKQKVPLLWVHFNYPKYDCDGAKGSCVCSVHPELANDKDLQDMLNNLIDHIRENYNMEQLTKI